MPEQLGALTSIAKDIYTPFVNQRSAYGLLDVDNQFLKIRVRTRASAFSRISSQRTFGPYGTYRWTAKIENPQTNMNLYMGFYGGFSTGRIMLRVIGTTYQLRCAGDESSGIGKLTTTNLANQDWTTEKVFQIAWTGNAVVLSVDGTTVATLRHPYVPDKPMFFICKVENDSTAPVNQGGIDLLLSGVEQIV